MSSSVSSYEAASQSSKGEDISNMARSTKRSPRTRGAAAGFILAAGTSHAAHKEKWHLRPEWFDGMLIFGPGDLAEVLADQVRLISCIR